MERTAILFFILIYRKAEGPNKCIDKVCVNEEDLGKPTVPEEYFLAADGDYFYVSTIELPWAQAQYECLAYTNTMITECW